MNFYKLLDLIRPNNHDLSEYIAMEERSFTNLVDKLEEIREEVHKTNSQMRDFNATQRLELVEAKAEIYATCFSKLVETVDYDKEMEQVKTSINTKVDKSAVNLLWVVLTTILMGLIAYLQLN